MSSERGIVAVTMGDAAGVGPELCLHLLAREKRRRRRRRFFPLVLGSAAVLVRARRELKLPFAAPILKASPKDGRLSEPAVLDLPTELEAVRLQPGQVNAVCGAAAAKFIEEGVSGCLNGTYAALCTAPLHKKALAAAGSPFPGHTEMLAYLTHTKRFAMLLHGGGISVALVTCHCSLRSVPEKLTAARIVEVGRLLAEALPRLRPERKGKPRIAVLGLNPHAGEEGLFGDEEKRLIVPAVRRLRRQGLEAEGPIPPDTAFTPAALARWDGHLAMYHDQGLIPIKTLAFGSAVNLTLGLPFVRTSPDHGTAFDIAWRGKADPAGIACAYDTAVDAAD